MVAIINWVNRTPHNVGNFSKKTIKRNMGKRHLINNSLKITTNNLNKKRVTVKKLSLNQPLKATRKNNKNNKNRVYGKNNIKILKSPNLIPITKMNNPVMGFATISKKVPVMGEAIPIEQKVQYVTPSKLTSAKTPNIVKYLGESKGFFGRTPGMRRLTVNNKNKINNFVGINNSSNHKNN
jgi:hypothetical protein